MQPGKNNLSGVIGTSSSEGPAISYDQIVELIRQGAEGVAAQGRDVLPTLAICSAFDDFNALSVGRGLDEETLTSLFLGHLGSSIRHASCILGLSAASAGGLGLRWLHYSRPAESVLGSDFALLVAAPGQEERYRLAVFQAKRCKGSPVNVRREPNWGSDEKVDGVANAEHSIPISKETRKERRDTRIADADRDLDQYHALLTGLEKGEKQRKDFSQEMLEKLAEAQQKKHWQLTKLILLALRLRLSFDSKDGVGVYYVLWPEQSGSAVTYARVSAATLERRTAAQAEPAESSAEGDSGSWTQSLALPATQLRDLLMEWLTTEDSTDDWLDASAAADACRMVTDCVGTVAVVDLRGPGHSPQLENALDGHDLSLRAEVKPLEGYGRHSAKSDLTL
ncbi:hypothetical protein WG628_10025 [Stenotrophomonas maltophilia]